MSVPTKATPGTALTGAKIFPASSADVHCFLPVAGSSPKTWVTLVGSVRLRVADVGRCDEPAVDERGGSDLTAERAARRELGLPHDLPGLAVEGVERPALVACAHQVTAVRRPEVGRRADVGVLPGRVGRGEDVRIGELRRPLELPGPVVDRKERVGHRRGRLGQALAGPDEQQPAVDVDGWGRPDAGSCTCGLVSGGGVELPALLARLAVVPGDRSAEEVLVLAEEVLEAGRALQDDSVDHHRRGADLGLRVARRSWPPSATRPWSGRGRTGREPLDAYTRVAVDGRRADDHPADLGSPHLRSGVGLDRPHRALPVSEVGDAVDDGRGAGHTDEIGDLPSLGQTCDRRSGDPGLGQVGARSGSDRARTPANGFPSNRRWIPSVQSSTPCQSSGCGRRRRCQSCPSSRPGPRRARRRGPSRGAPGERGQGRTVGVRVPPPEHTTTGSSCLRTG